MEGIDGAYPQNPSGSYPFCGSILQENVISHREAGREG